MSAGIASRRTFSPVLAVEVDRLHVDQVDDAFEADSRPIGICSGQRSDAAAFRLICSITLTEFAPVRSILLMNAMRGTL